MKVFCQGRQGCGFRTFVSRAKGRKFPAMGAAIRRVVPPPFFLGATSLSYKESLIVSSKEKGSFSSTAKLL